VRKREPRLERTIQELADEHRQLMQSLETLRQQARSDRCPDQPFREVVRRWVKRVQHHEARENGLVQDAFNQDIGAED
jgi:hypothetical protein